MIKITNLKSGETSIISRDARATHPAWVHAQLGTSSEGELQSMLDGANVADWYRDGRHLGPDTCGLEMVAD